ncbi:hypothetical protein J1N35_039627 [Gossypium stocksii]|uniref:Uncharacterized protein n=1 Tax=Gossypium stocksii TaxID=47602 RepID=A0A9D3UCJ2_9ROSI|nr:hypothetical protein J1N35_039627 [Gossypium stocksii]
MVVHSDQQPRMTFKDKLLGGSGDSSDGNIGGNLRRHECRFEILDGDVKTPIVNGIPAIAFSDRIKDLLFKEMERTVILKLLGRNIGYNVLYNCVCWGFPDTCTKNKLLKPLEV